MTKKVVTCSNCAGCGEVVAKIKDKEVVLKCRVCKGKGGWYIDSKRY